MVRAASGARSVLRQLTAMAVLTACLGALNKKYLEPCSRTEDCVDAFLCLNSVCDCVTNQTVSSDHLLCLKGVTYGEPCRETGQCLLHLVDTVCGSKDKCECSAGYDFNPADNSCSTIVDAAVAHGGKCRLSRQCKSGMVCEGQICECRSGLYWERSLRACVPNVGAGPLHAVRVGEATQVRAVRVAAALRPFHCDNNNNYCPLTTTAGGSDPRPSVQRPRSCCSGFLLLLVFFCLSLFNSSRRGFEF
ncbi:uncharacterized protein LOC134530862 isoform X2 [Bacillus rossius redtenbacheri]|uniref:uncharacterized protein LOC134530862 isoform X2 n=1 Tax=Bacillus rossius redtenbacheri TaxID=93214 RepID=UPI002FDCBDB7